VRVSAWSNGSGTFGVHVGARNRAVHFDPDWSEVTVEIDGANHRFGLTDGFWRKCPEFRDRGAPIIREWLRKYRTTEWERGDPPVMELVPLGGRRFRLLP
jgi:hypothetical protein